MRLLTYNFYFFIAPGANDDPCDRNSHTVILSNVSGEEVAS